MTRVRRLATLPLLGLALGLVLVGEAAAQQFANTDQTLATGGFVDQGGGTSLHLAIGEGSANDADYIWSDTQGTIAHLRLTTLSDPVASTGHILRIRAWGEDKTNQTGELRLYENGGGTLRATYTFTIPSRRAWEDLSYTLTGAEADSIANYADLSIRIENTDVANREMRVSWFQMEVPAPGGNNPPALSTPTAVNITDTAADLGGTIDNNGGAAVNAHGTVWNTTGTPAPVTPTDNPEDLGATAGPFPLAFSSTRGDGSPAGDNPLPAGTRIFYRGFATNGEGTAYSPQGSFYTEPSTQASSVTFGTVTSNSIQVNWTPGSGAGSLVVMRAGSAPVAPEDGTEYAFNSDFTLAGETGPGSRVVATSGSTVTVTNLTPSTTYFVAVYEYAGTGNDAGDDLGINYKPVPATGNRATDAGVSAPSLSAPVLVGGLAGVSSTNATLGATQDSNNGAPVTARGITWNTTGTPAAGTDATVQLQTGADLANGAFSGDVGSLTAGTRIFFRGYATNSAGTGHTVADGTVYMEPASQPTNLNFTATTSSSMTVNWSDPGGATGAEGAIVVMKAGSDPNAGDEVPADGSDASVYSPNSDWGSAGTIGAGGAKVVFVGSGNSVNVTNLAADTTYFVRIYEFAGTGPGDTGINYLEETPLSGSNATDPPTGNEPTVQASNIVFEIVASKALRFSWTRGNGEGSVATIRVQGTPRVPPVDFSDYTADREFPLAPETSTGSGNYVVSKGVLNRVIVYGLTPGTTYVVNVYEFNGTGVDSDYLTAAPPEGTQATDGPAMHNYENGANCTDCHSNHGNSGLIPHGTNQEDACRTCHVDPGPAKNKLNFALHLTPNYPATDDVDCGSCHEVHAFTPLSEDSTLSTHPVSLVNDHNLSFIRANVDKWVTTATPDDAVYQVKPDDLAVEDGTATTSRGICQACHTDASNHRHDGTGDQCHNGQGGNCGPAQTDCFLCHTHIGNFAPSGGDCTGCHNSPQPISAPTRREIVSEFGRTTSHVAAASLDPNDCEVCHAQDVTGHLHGGEGGTDFQVTVFNADDKTTTYSLGMYADPFTTRSEAATLTPFCLSCHDVDGAQEESNAFQPFTDSGAPPNIAATWSSSSHATINQQAAPNGSGSPTTCFGDGDFGCHASAHGSLKVDMLAPDTSDGGTNNSGELEGFCLNCHVAGGASSIDIDALFGGLATDFQVTTGAQYTTVNQKHDVLPADQTYSSSVMTCKDCHDPHAATDANPTVNPDTGAALGTYQWNGSYSGDAPSFNYDSGTGDFDPSNPEGGQIAAGWPTDGPYPEPDYIEFCLTCHDGVAPAGVTLPPGTSLMRNIASDYGGDQHGAAVGNSSASRGYLKQPWVSLSDYNAGIQPSQGYAALNCTTCHSPHGTGNIYHLRTSITVAGQAMTVGGKDVFVDPATCTRQCDSIINALPEFGSTTYTLPLNTSGQQEDLGWGAWCTFCHEPSHGTSDGLSCNTGHRHGTTF